jgi:hypothetical protein
MDRAALFGLAASIPVALVYGVLADPFGLSWGLVIVGIVGGFIIGAAVVQGAFNGRFHLIIPRLRWLAAIIGVICWVAAAVVAYVSSQVFYQGAATPLMERLSIGGLVDYLGSTVFSPSILGLAAMAFMAWRGAK